MTFQAQQQGDVKLFQTDNDGEINVVDGVTEMSGGLETAAYLCLFGGNEDDDGRADNQLQWWGNWDETDVDKMYRSETQFLLQGLPAIPANILTLEAAAVRDLAMFTNKKIANEVSVVVTMPGLNRVNYQVTINAFGELSEFNFTENWGVTPPAQEMEVLGPALPPGLVVDALVLDANPVNSSRHVVTAAGDANISESGKCSFAGAGTLTVASSTDFDMANSTYSIEAKINRSGDQSGDIINRITGATGWKVAYNHGTGKIDFTANATTISSTTSIALNTDYAIGIFDDGQNATLYINGIAEVQTAALISSNSEPLVFGSSFIGTISQVEINPGVYRQASSPYTPPSAISVDEFSVLTIDFKGDGKNAILGGETRILDKSKPSYNLTTSDDFTSPADQLNSKRWTETILGESGSGFVVSGGQCTITSISSSGVKSTFMDNTLPDQTGEFDISCKVNVTNGKTGIKDNRVSIQIDVGGGATVRTIWYNNVGGAEKISSLINGVEVFVADTFSDLYFRTVRDGSDVVTNYYKTTSGGSWIPIDSRSQTGTLTGARLVAQADGSTVVFPYEFFTAVDGSGNPITFNTDTGNTPFFYDVSPAKSDGSEATNMPIYDPAVTPAAWTGNGTNQKFTTALALPQDFDLITVANVTASAAVKALMGDSNAYIALDASEFATGFAGSLIQDSTDHSGVDKIFELSVASGVGILYVNGAQVATGAVGAGDIAAFLLLTNGADFAPCTFKRGAAYSKVLSAFERQHNNDYLIDEYGIAV